MRRFSFCWQRAIRALLVLMIVVVASHLAIGAAMRWIINRSGDGAATKFQVASAGVSPFNRKIVIDRLSVLSSRGSNKSLFEADNCRLNVLLGPLLHKQLVVAGGQVTGLRLGNALILSSSGNKDTSKAHAHQWLPEDSDLSAREWLAQLIERFKQDSVAAFESLRRTEAVAARWPDKRAALIDRAAELESRAHELQRATVDAEANRLRHADFFRGLPKQVAALQQDFDDLSAEMDACSTALDDDRRAIIAARQSDEAGFRDSLHVDPIDSNALSAYFLREQLTDSLNELVGWLRLVRQAVPAGSKSTVSRKRGEDILFAGCRPAPNLLIRELELHGVARLGDQSVELRGQLSNLSGDPARHDEPLRLRLTGTGALPIEIRATIDRTGSIPRDELLVDCRGIEMPGLSIGRTNALQLNTSRSVSTVSISVATVGDSLRGDIQVVQKNLQMSPVLHGELATLPLAAPLESTLGKVNSVVTRVAIAGTIDEPSCTLWSNLGPAVAEALERAANRAGEEHAVVVLTNARRKVDEKLADLERQLGRERMSVSTQLAALNGRLNQIAQRQAPPERITTERLGRRLPENSLFR